MPQPYGGKIVHVGEQQGTLRSDFSDNPCFTFQIGVVTNPERLTAEKRCTFFLDGKTCCVVTKLTVEN